MASQRRRKDAYDSPPRYECISRGSLGEMPGEMLIEAALKLMVQAAAESR